jgi:Phage gp6-like head-tail connector protein
MGGKAVSVVSLVDAKSFLDVIHNSDDGKLQNLLDAAEDEASRFLNVESLEEWTELPFSIFIAVLLLLQANYQASPDDMPKLRASAEGKLMPFRVDMGV